MSAISEFTRGDGPVIETGYRRGDSWVQVVGAHTDCSKRVLVLGPGIGRDRQGRMGRGVLVRCQGCLTSWVIR